jgi:short-subunit dehydrogenase
MRLTLPPKHSCCRGVEALAIELDETAISVTALCPGVTDTDFFEKGSPIWNCTGKQIQNR